MSGNFLPSLIFHGRQTFLFVAILFVLISPFTAPAQELKSREIQVRRELMPAFDEEGLRKKMMADGLSGPVIGKLIEQHRKWHESGRKVAWSRVSASSPSPMAGCNGLGVETGWGAWLTAEGSNDNPAQINSNIAWGPITTPAASTNVGLSTGAGIDPNTPGPNPGDPPLPVVCPGFGNTSIVMNPGCLAGFLCEQLTYPLTITSTDTNFVYAFAVILQDGNSNGGQPHTPDNQPYVEFSILDANGVPIPCAEQRYLGGANAPGFYEVNGQACAVMGDLYKPWTLVGVNLSAYVGQTLTVVITNVGCSLGGHFVKSYWDFLCGTTTLTAGCVGNQSNICGPDDPNIGYSYQWFLNNAAIPGANQQCVTLTPAQGDTIKVMVTTPDGCGFSMAYTPEMNQPAFNAVTTCDPVRFSGNTTSLGTSVATGWSWSFPGGTPGTANTQQTTVSYPGPGNYNATLTVTYSSGCTATASLPVQIGPSSLNAAFNSDSLCEGTPFTFTDLTTTPSSDPIVSRNWTFTTGTPSTATTPTVAVTFPLGSHTAQLSVVTASGCSTSVSRPLSVFRNPDADFSVPATACLPFCHPFSDASTSSDGSITAWNWNFSGGNPSTLVQATGTSCWSQPGSQNITLQVETEFGCTDTAIRTIQTLPIPLALISGDTAVCLDSDPPLIQLMGVNSVAPYTFSYTNNGAVQQIVSDITGKAVVAVPTGQSGNFEFEVTGVTSSSLPPCSSAAAQKATVVVEAPPLIDFSTDAVDCPGSATIRFSNLTSNGHRYVWDFGDGQSSTELNPQHYFYIGGDYDVQLVATSPLGCADSITRTISVNQDFRLWMPNAFTPNNDELNERFYPNVISANTLKLSIFNRWGDLVYQTDDLGAGWDGTYNGQPAAEGAYVFKVDATDLCDNPKVFTGKFFLVR